MECHTGGRSWGRGPPPTASDGIWGPDAGTVGAVLTTHKTFHGIALAAAVEGRHPFARDAPVRGPRAFLWRCRSRGRWRCALRWWSCCTGRTDSGARAPHARARDGVAGRPPRSCVRRGAGARRVAAQGPGTFR